MNWAMITTQNLIMNFSRFTLSQMRSLTKSIETAKPTFLFSCTSLRYPKCDLSKVSGCNALKLSPNIQFQFSIDYQIHQLSTCVRPDCFVVITFSEFAKFIFQ